jgi:hypothetical protein
MLANIKIKAIEDLKMSRAEEYDYNKFLSDSSDDFPKYDDGIETKSAFTDSGYAVIDEVALNNVLTLASERMEEIRHSKDVNADYLIAQDSIEKVKKLLCNTQNSNIALAKNDKD